MGKRLVVFDLDGTLLNTIADLGQACNHALEQVGYPLHALDQYPFMVGNGITRLIERALPAGNRDEDTVATVRRHFIDFYGDHCMDFTRPYDGIPELLEMLVARGVMVAVASNKYQEAVSKLIGHYFGQISWVAVEGQRESRAVKPCPQVVYDIMSKTGIVAGEVLYVGDSGVDIDTACNAGVDVVGVSWGFRPESELREHGAVHVISRPGDLLSFV